MLTLERWHHLSDVRFGASTGATSDSGAMQRGIVYHRKVYKLLKVQAAVSWPDWKLLVEPWFLNLETRAKRSPDAILLNAAEQQALVIEVKMNWKDGRDEKLLDEYLPIARSAFELRSVKPLLITGNVRGYQHKPLLGLGAVMNALAWEPGKPTPLLLVPTK